MKGFKLLILGCNSATPTTNSHPTSQYLSIQGHHFLIDCGEGTQVQLRKYKVQFLKITHIFISHLHGDHYYGLPGIISSFNLLDRKKPLTIFGPKGLKEILHVIIENSHTTLKFDLIIDELEKQSPQIIFDTDSLSVETIPLDHRIYTNGFLFREKIKERHLNIEAIKKYPGIDISDYQNLKNGRGYTTEKGELIPNTELTYPPKKSLSYAFCSDTAFDPDIIPQLRKIDLLYHESTFLEEHKHLATSTKHSTAGQAAKIAKYAQVGKLILGHYSNRYPNRQLFLEEAQQIFPNTQISHEGKLIELERQSIEYTFGS